MRLKNMKLAGFKSFVDPITVSFPSQIISVVGPNGCGKSNIIDAVRWVLGEVSAKQLRGESMADVIFNGSTKRKPVGMASVELTFDNTDGLGGGEYAKYSTIAIRREVTRDGASNYYLNGTRCRRRDITDVIQGTGLGARSYSIIKQDTISRIIEADPQTLRNHLEEAAGIAKYKERRRETETRMRHTRENLERLQDIREELHKQLRHLEKQRDCAEKFTVYQEEKRLLSAQLIAMQWQSLEEKLSRDQQFAEKLQTSMAAQQAIIQKHETQLHRYREENNEFNDLFNETQSHFYQCGNQVSQLEQDITHREERAKQIERDIHQLDSDLLASQTHQIEDQQQITILTEQLLESEPEWERAKETVEQITEILSSTEANFQDWQMTWTQTSNQLAQARQTAEVQQAHIQHCEQRLKDNEQRIEKSNVELEHLSDHQERQAIEEYNEHLAEKEHAHDLLRVTIQDNQSALATKRKKAKELEHLLHVNKTNLQQALGKHVSLLALQQVALGKDQEATMSWLSQQGFEQAPRLAEKIQVESGWERAVEVALGKQAQAICVDSIQAIMDKATQCRIGQLSFYATEQQSNEATSNHPLLLDKITAPFSLGSILMGVIACEDMTAAMSLLPTLAPGQSVITREGLWFNQYWCRVTTADDTQGGLLAREKALQHLTEEIPQLEKEILTIEANLKETQEQIHQVEQATNEAQADLNVLAEEKSMLKAKIQVKQARVEQKEQRRVELNKQINEYVQTIDNIKREYQNARAIWDSALAQVETMDRQRQQLTEEGEACKQVVQEAKARHQQATQTAYQIEVKVQTLQSKLRAIEDNLSRVTVRLEELTLRKQQLEQQRGQVLDALPSQQQRLQSLLTQRVAAEEAMRQARQRLEQHQENMEAIEAQKQTNTVQLESIRSELEQTKMALNSNQVRQQNLLEQLAESTFELQALQQEMPGEANITEWDERVSQLERKIARLGPINLAAIEEFNTLSERKIYLDEQNADLELALSTLETAIKKIDTETRELFRETLDKVNGDFKTLFPKIFSGGEAYLELTEGDLLEAGVLVKARPPGKRNATIHLLSGGEKALTAISLVFAIFQLNPAPFCMLDEVDAPLDDANVSRFCNLVKEMSEKVQFIVITHNKVTMEMADQLMGVTMHEPGVSRLVSVDIDDAVALAEV